MFSPIKNNITKTESGVWVRSELDTFNYSDGEAIEKYLANTIDLTSDLGSGSSELEKYIIDWASCYHLDRRRANLLRAFNFEKSSKVLEIGCGCGAITRYLGENFESVIGVEGSRIRSEIARSRTQGQENVEIVCLPFQEFTLEEKSDITFCIGVLEYVSKFIAEDNPYDAALNKITRNLKDNGLFVLAIENKFGLKYFAGAKEDHTNTKYEGIEGYPRYKGQVETFGKHELQLLLKKYFNDVIFYYPYPDYKLPTCILSDDALGIEKIDNMIPGSFQNRFLTERGVNFDELFALRQLQNNRQLGFFANSFVVIAGNDLDSKEIFSSLGVSFTAFRRNKFLTTTSLYQDKKDLVVNKEPITDVSLVEGQNILLNACKSKWIDGDTVFNMIAANSKNRIMTFNEIIQPISFLFQFVELNHGKARGGERSLPGEYVDLNLKNLVVDENGKSHFVDKEWFWKQELLANAVTVRAIYHLFCELKKLKDVSRTVSRSPIGLLIFKTMRSNGRSLKAEDLVSFLILEREICKEVYGISTVYTYANVFLNLLSISTKMLILELVNFSRKVKAKALKSYVLYVSRK